MSEGRQSKIREQYLRVQTHQHILRLDITVEELLLMGVLQSSGHLLDRGEDLRERDYTACGKALPQRAKRGIIHHQKRYAVLDIEIEDAHNGGMGQHCNGLCFLLEVLNLLAGQMCMQHFDGRLQWEPEVLTEIHLGKPALAQLGDQSIVAKLLSDTICYGVPPRMQDEVRLSW